MTHLHLKFTSIVALSLGLAVLSGCGSTKDTTQKNTPISARSTTTLLKTTTTSGVKTFVLYDLDIKALSRDETKQLDALAQEIKAMGTCQVTVIGHTDNIGTSEVNEAVSKERARLVTNYLKKQGVSNITSSGESYNHPIAGNDTAAGRAKNRRVEVYVSTIGKYNPYK